MGLLRRKLVLLNLRSPRLLCRHTTLFNDSYDLASAVCLVVFEPPCLQVRYLE